jgi:D-amino-acid oxidase
VCIGSWHQKDLAFLHSTTMASKVLVVGSGAIGLRTALELIRRNVPVVLQSPKHPLHPSTCSVGAGGLWMPFHVSDPRASRWAAETLDELMPFANDPSSNLAEIVPAVVLKREHCGPIVEDFATYKYKSTPGEQMETTKLPEWSRDTRIEFQHLTVEMLAWQNIVNQLLIPPEQELVEAGYKHAYFFKPPIVNAPAMLEHLLSEVTKGAEEVNVETGVEYQSIDHLRETAESFGCDAVVNCTGLGAAKLCNDDQVVGARGILLSFDREKCVRRVAVREGLYGDNKHGAVIITEEEPWGTNETPAYLIPRGDLILVGGSYLEGDTEESIRGEERERLMRNAEKLGIDTEKSPITGEWTGFRPFRSTVRCALDPDVSKNVRVVHSYGYGGSGWTVNVGAAKESADILLGTPKQ